MMKRLIIACLLVLSLGGILVAQDIETTKIKLQEINAILNQKKDKLAQIQQQERQALNKIKEIKQAMRNAQNNLRYTNYRLQVNQQKVADLESELRQEKQQLAEELVFFKQRIRQISKNQSLGYLELFFSTSTLSEFINKSYFFETIIARDAKIIGELQAHSQSIQQTKIEIEKKVKELQSSRSNIDNQTQAIEEKMLKEDKVYSNLSARRRAYQKEVNDLEKDSQDLEVYIQKLFQEKGVKLKGTGTFAWPLPKGSYWISSSYGSRFHPIFRVRRFHSGVDLAAVRNTSVLAADSGEVIFAGLWGGYGRAIIINHGNGYSTVYAHMSRLLVEKGDTVFKGAKIGLVGSTGYATGPHLHFEIRQDGKTINPLGHLPKL